MAVVAHIYEPVDEIEEQFDVPVCTTSVYRELILPRAERLGLDVFLQWSGLYELTQDERGEFSRQVGVFKEALLADEKITEDTREFLIFRLDNLIRNIEAAIQRRADAVFLIC